MFRPKSKRHCKDDIACGHCCSCALKNKLQLEVREKTLNQVISKLQSELKVSKDANIELVKELQKFRKIKKQLDNFDELKNKIKEELRDEIGQERKVQDMLKQQKIKQLTSDNQQLTIKVRELLSQNHTLKEELENIHQSHAELVQEVNTLREQNQNIKDKFEESMLLIEQLKDQNQTKERQIQEKTQIITKMQKIINDLQGRFTLERTKANNYQLQNKTLSLNLKARDSYIESLSKANENNLKNMTNLQGNNTKLKTLLSTIDIENAAFRINEEYLKDRIVETQNLAFHNGQKVQCMKTDLHNLKLRI